MKPVKVFISLLDGDFYNQTLSLEIEDKTFEQIITELTIIIDKVPTDSGGKTMKGTYKILAVHIPVGHKPINNKDVFRIVLDGEEFFYHLPTSTLFLNDKFDSIKEFSHLRDVQKQQYTKEYIRIIELRNSQ